MAAGAALAARLGLTVVRAPDRPGFLVGALLYPHLADAVRMVQDGYATAHDVDTAMMLGCGYPQGPFQLLDAAGAAVVLAGLRAMYDRLRLSGFRAAAAAGRARRRRDRVPQHRRSRLVGAPGRRAADGRRLSQVSPRKARRLPRMRRASRAGPGGRTGGRRRRGEDAAPARSAADAGVAGRRLDRAPGARRRGDQDLPVPRLRPGTRARRTAHVVVWPADGPGADERRHWHNACWQRRPRRPGPGPQTHR